MSKFCVATDSGCDLPISLCREREIYPLQMPYYIGEEEFIDTMNHDDFKSFYDKIRDGAVPRTSQVNIYEFVSFWESLLHLKTAYCAYLPRKRNIRNLFKWCTGSGDYE